MASQRRWFLQAGIHALVAMMLWACDSPKSLLRPTRSPSKEGPVVTRGHDLHLDLLRWELRQRAPIAIGQSRYQDWAKPASAMSRTVDPSLVDPMHPSPLNLKVYGLQDVLSLYLIADLMEDYNILRLVTKNHAYASRMAEAGSMVLRLDRAIEELELRRHGDDGWSKVNATARLRYREGKVTWTAICRLTADVLSSPDGYRWKVVDATPPTEKAKRREVDDSKGHRRLCYPAPGTVHSGRVDSGAHCQLRRANLPAGRASTTLVPAALFRPA